MAWGFHPTEVAQFLFWKHILIHHYKFSGKWTFFFFYYFSFITRHVIGYPGSGFKRCICCVYKLIAGNRLLFITNRQQKLNCKKRPIFRPSHQKVSLSIISNFYYKPKSFLSLIHNIVLIILRFWTILLFYFHWLTLC